MERYFLVTTTRRVGAARVNLFQKHFARSDGDESDRELNSGLQIIIIAFWSEFKLIEYGVYVSTREMISTDKFEQTFLSCEKIGFFYIHLLTHANSEEA